MILIVGGAFQGKLDYACRLTGYKKEDFLDGGTCLEEAAFGAKGIRHFHEYIKNRMKGESACRERIANSRMRLFANAGRCCL